MLGSYGGGMNFHTGLNFMFSFSNSQNYNYYVLEYGHWALIGPYNGLIV